MLPAPGQGQLLGLSHPQDTAGEGMTQLQPGMGAGTNHGREGGCGHWDVDGEEAQQGQCLLQWVCFQLFHAKKFCPGSTSWLSFYTRLSSPSRGTEGGTGCTAGTPGHCWVIYKYSKLKFSVAPRVSDPLQEGYNGLVGLQ